MSKDKKKVPRFFTVSLCIFLLCLAALIASRLSESAADFFNITVAHAYRYLTAKISGLIEFSLFELIVILLPLIILLIVFFSIKAFGRMGGATSFFLNLVAAVMLFASTYILGLGIGYSTTPVAEKMNIVDTEITEERLALSMIYLRDEVNRYAEKLAASEDGTSDPQCDLSVISDRICDSYDILSQEGIIPHSFKSGVKPVYFSNVMSYLALGGIYTFYTGEANVNVAYPMYDVSFTAAHELAHQRGIMRENEANFVAYLALSSSEDTYLRYSGALNMYSYIASALYRTDKERYYEIAKELCPLAVSDISASNEITRKYANTPIADLSELLNDLFLKSNGTEGVVSYGKVVELTVAYLESTGRI